LVSSGAKAIFWGGFAAGVLDITQAILAFGLMRGVKPIRIPQSIASGLLGPKAYQGGWQTATLGMLLHFFIAFTAAAVFYLASRKLRWMTERPILAGILYGEVVWAFMRYVVIQSSRMPLGPLTGPSLLTGPIGHIFCVGLPIALAVKKWGDVR
jgi:hypothetical protein